MFKTLGPLANIIKNLGIIYTSSSIFPNDFDWGYTDGDEIPSKKFYNVGDFQNVLTYFVTVVSYLRKMFMKLTHVQAQAVTTKLFRAVSNSEA